MLTVKDAAAQLGITRVSIYRAILDGRLKAQKRYGRYVLSESAIEKYRGMMGVRNGYHKRNLSPERSAKMKAAEEPQDDYWAGLIGIVRSEDTRGARNAGEVFAEGVAEKKRQGDL